MAASVQSWQFVHSATSMIMFHFFIAPLSESVGWATARNGYRTISYFPAPLPTICTSALLVALMVGKARETWSQSQLGALRLCPPYTSFCWNELRFPQRALDLGVLLHGREGRRHVLGAAVPQLDLNECIGACERVCRLGLRFVRGEQVEAAAAVDRLAGLAHRIVHRRRLVAMADAARQPLRRQRRADHGAAFVVDLH